jgi:hypothetical protein
MMNARIKITVFCVLVLLGISLLCYGLFFHSTIVSAEQKGDAKALAKSEPNLIKEVSVGGVKRDESGKVKQTYDIGEEAPKACPT